MAPSSTPREYAGAGSSGHAVRADRDLTGLPSGTVERQHHHSHVPARHFGQPIRNSIRRVRNRCGLPLRRRMDLGSGDLAGQLRSPATTFALRRLETLLKAALRPSAKVLGQGGFRCRGCGVKGRRMVPIKGGIERVAAAHLSSSSSAFASFRSGVSKPSVNQP